MDHEAGMDEMGTARVASEGHSEGVKGQEAVASQAAKAEPVKSAAAKKAPVKRAPAKKPAPAPEVQAPVEPPKAAAKVEKPAQAPKVVPARKTAPVAAPAPAKKTAAAKKTAPVPAPAPAPKIAAAKKTAPAPAPAPAEVPAKGKRTAPAAAPAPAPKTAQAKKPAAAKKTAPVPAKAKAKAKAKASAPKPPAAAGKAAVQGKGKPAAKKAQAPAPAPVKGKGKGKAGSKAKPVAKKVAPGGKKPVQAPKAVPARKAAVKGKGKAPAPAPAKKVPARPKAQAKAKAAVKAPVPAAKLARKPAPPARKGPARPKAPGKAKAPVEVPAPVPALVQVAAPAVPVVPRTELEVCLQELVMPGLVAGHPFYVGQGVLLPADMSGALRSYATRVDSNYMASGGQDLMTQRREMMDAAERKAKLEGLTFTNTKEHPKHLASLEGYKEEPGVRFMRFHQRVSMPRGESWQAARTGRDQELGVSLVLALGDGPLEPMDYIICQQLTQRLVTGRPLTVVGVIRPRWSSRKESTKTIANEVLLLEAYDEMGRMVYQNGLLSVAQAKLDMEAVRGRQVPTVAPRAAGAHVLPVVPSAPLVAAPAPAQAPAAAPLAPAPAPVPAAPAPAPTMAKPQPVKVEAPKAEPAAAPSPAPVVPPPVRSNLRAHLLGQDRVNALDGMPVAGSAAAAGPAAPEAPAAAPVPAAQAGEGGASELSRRLGQSNDTIRVRVLTYIQEHPAGSSLGDILGFFAIGADDPNLKGIRNFLGLRILDPLQSEGLVEVRGERRWARYFAKV